MISMDEFEDENSLTDWLLSEGIRVVEAVLPAGMWGLYQPDKKRILIRAGMPDSYRFPALLHEAYHVIRGDIGHQSPKVEAEINRNVALHRVNPVDFMFAEDQVGYHTPGIAKELNLPRWVIQAYRDLLSRGQLV